MKLFPLTPVRDPKISAEIRYFIKPSLLRQGGHPSTSVGGFSFGNAALTRSIQSKEVDIVKEGINLHKFNVTFHSSIRKGITL